ncbi:unnamed protein product [Gemmataceae bacterium]|nr:unnamed protein product [Gemmataceae bacterium]VTT97846.1 unnamed protein product [Gemmataceae bacterium]
MSGVLCPLGSTPDLQCGHGCEPWVMVWTLPAWGRGAAPLQCGHGCEPWVIGASPAAYRSTASFNAATAVSRGSSLGVPTAAAGPRLQCGHGCEPWVISSRAARTAEDTPLQCGHGCEPWVMTSYTAP